MVELKQSGRCGLPGDIKMQDYPEVPYINSQRDDTIKGIDKRRSNAISTIKKHKDKAE